MSRALVDLHPWLRERVEDLLDLYAAAALSRLREPVLLLVTDTTRTQAEQQAAHAAGRSQLDGVTRWSLHQYAPGLACDLVPTISGRAIWDASTVTERARWDLLGELAEAQGLGWGGRWRTLVDRPHVEVPERQRVVLLQTALGVAPDGDFGPKTLVALQVRERAAGLPLTDRATWWRVRPASWAEVLRAPAPGRTR